MELLLAFPIDTYKEPEHLHDAVQSEADQKKAAADAKSKQDPKQKKAQVVQEDQVAKVEDISEADLLLRSQKMKPVTDRPIIERAVYLFDYRNRDFLKLLQKTLVDINLEGLGIVNGSERDVRTKKLTEEEKKNKTLDYIGGVEFMDKHFRMFILEGVTHLGMRKLQERIIKTAANTPNFKIMKDPSITFDHRLYSDFDVDVKKVKLREPLKTLLLLPQLYLREKVPLQTYTTIMTLANTKEKNTIHELVSSDLWLTSEVTCSNIEHCRLRA